MNSPPDHLAAMTTELRNEASSSIDAASTLEIVDLINREDQLVAQAVAAERESIAAAIDVITHRLREGGRLLYIGAGTSGRLGVLDASECPPTFNTPPSMVVGIIAGGREALTNAIEGAEDNPQLS
ncbi:MAG: N-acetylmuramic acid 6-phosphate etherase, partial [Planctomycetales bacterium]|nr:N-acetylmuramic acid 6-phosphate etherase [Planctomycetales bacterium]